jgi:hypothetical protein
MRLTREKQFHPLPPIDEITMQNTLGKARRTYLPPIVTRQSSDDIKAFADFAEDARLLSLIDKSEVMAMRQFRDELGLSFSSDAEEAPPSLEDRAYNAANADIIKAMDTPTRMRFDAIRAEARRTVRLASIASGSRPPDIDVRQALKLLDISDEEF